MIDEGLLERATEVLKHRDSVIPNYTAIYFADELLKLSRKLKRIKDHEVQNISLRQELLKCQVVIRQLRKQSQQDIAIKQSLQGADKQAIMAILSSVKPVNLNIEVSIGVEKLKKTVKHTMKSQE